MSSAAHALGALALASVVAVACAPQSHGRAGDVHADSPVGEAARPRPEIPTDWPKGKRIVMHVTPSLDKSYVVACDMPVPALTYIERGHFVTIAVDRAAITAFRRDADGKTPLDRLALLDEDLDRLADALHVPTPNVPKTFGDLYRMLAAKGVRIVTGDNVLRAAGVTRAQLDPGVDVLRAEDFSKLLGDLDALLPYDDVTPFESIFNHRPGQESGHPSGHP
jgi:hypothetical protein